MKKLLFGILTFLGIGLSFCSASDTSVNISLCETVCINTNGDTNGDFIVNFIGEWDSWVSYSYYRDSFGTVLNDNHDLSPFYSSDSITKEGKSWICAFYYVPSVCTGGLPSQGGGSSSSDIDVYYNNGNSVENITCDGTQAISIDGLSTITSTNTFTPYFNISYTDEDNQKLTESYSKDILYLENGQFKKTYTGNNDWILSVQGGSENFFSGYLPTFEITGGIEEVSGSGNIFNNFAENSVKFTLSNIPSYIQYVILLFILFFILGFIRKFRRK